jgi:hypothetical protein
MAIATGAHEGPGSRTPDASGTSAPTKLATLATAAPVSACLTQLWSSPMCP